MALRIQPRRYTKKDGTVSESWRLIVDEYGKDGKRARSIYPEPKDYRHYGLNPDDTLAEARRKLDSVRAAERAKKTLEKRAKIEQRIRDEERLESAYLPRHVYEKFLKFVLQRRALDTVPPKMRSHLLTMRRCIHDLKLDPSEWPTRPGAIFRWFEKNGYSVSYLEKILPLLNAYGFIYCREFAQPFLEVPMPTGALLERINDANYEARGGRTNESLPLTVELLEKLASFAPEKLRWLERSFWFGLRPGEVDSLTAKNRGVKWDVYTLTSNRKRIPVLKIYQAKLVTIARKRRWKHIPCLLPEQVRIAREIENGLPASRPYARFIQARLGPGYGLWGGRKGFEKLMREAGRSEITVARWMGITDFRTIDNAADKAPDVAISPKSISKMLGHTNLSRTENVYRERDAVDMGDEDEG
jgi:hypothetical protein